MLVGRREAAALLATGLLARSAHAAESVSPVRIGFLAELSGRFAAYGIPSRRGAVMALAAVDGKVAGRAVDLVVRDTQSNPQVAVTAMNELVNDPSIDCVVGPVASNIVTSIVPIWRQGKKVWLLPGASDTSLEKQAGGNPLFFHANPYAYDYHRALSEMLRAAVGPGASIGVIYTDGAFGRNHIEFVRQYYPAAGLRIVHEAMIPQNTVDMLPALMRIRQIKPEILLAVLETTDAVVLAKQVRTARLGVPYLIGMSFAQYVEWQNAVGPAQEGWVGVASFLPSLVRPADPQNPALFPASQEWVQAYKRRYTSDPDQLAAESFAAMGMLLLALQRAQAAGDLGRLAQELRSMKVQTLMGTGQFAPSPGGTLQQTFSTMTVFQRQGGTSAAISPPDVATSRLQRAVWST